MLVQQIAVLLRLMDKHLIFLFSIAICLSACGNGGDKEVNLRLTSKERREIDTLVAREVRMMRPLMDSICTANFNELVAAATDSIVQRRLEEELRLRARIPLENGRSDD